MYVCMYVCMYIFMLLPVVYMFTQLLYVQMLYRKVLGNAQFESWRTVEFGVLWPWKPDESSVGACVSRVCVNMLLYQAVDGVRSAAMSRMDSNNSERSSSRSRSSRSRPQSMDSSAYEKLLAGIGSVHG